MARDITELLSNDEDEDEASSDSSDDAQLLDNLDSSDDEGNVRSVCVTKYLKI